MKEETKLVLNKVKEIVVEHKQDIITFCAVSAIAASTGAICGRYMGQCIGRANAVAYKNGWQKGMTDFYSNMMTDNFDNAEVVKALVDFNKTHTK